ncbi:hypothetical protein GCM10007094_06040 [Pseudovibrio japonicus]|uniref:N-acetyltransferase domain-containing protein n=1 Tax=Pseudovibrio japonicus TaxID=366534 RepID=A0ABQ3E1V5_9HYPH|nr:GNAT family N-acetyltransferase [Pseudovibrio japonicus]GHB20797.1 hypothetical protein GCM10007094_06040 [Pseudovibrio japonicus]
MPKVIGVPFITYAAEPDDADLLANIYVTSTHDSRKALGHSNPDGLRRSFLQSFNPAQTFKLVRGCKTIGFYTLLEQLDHVERGQLWLLPEEQGEDVGTAAIKQALSFILKRAEPEDIEQLADLRDEAMKDEWAANGLTDYALARRHFFEDYKPEATWKIEQDGELLGFAAIHEYDEFIHLDMIYLLPAAQGQGIGSQILQNLKEHAQQVGKPIRLGALRISNSNRFYKSHGFHFTHNVDFNNYYEYAPQVPSERASGRLEQAKAEDFDLLADLRQHAMKDNMEANGLFDHALYRQYFKNSFDPASTWKITENEEVLGFYVLWNKPDHLYLERLYFLPKAQGRGIGAEVLTHLKQQATQQNKPIKLEVLPKSRANAFYQHNGFTLLEEREDENVYEWKLSQLTDTCGDFAVDAADKSDFNLLADIRQEAMQEEWAANGMFDHSAYGREFEKTFDPAFTRKITLQGKTVGFYVLWERDDHLYLERLYIQVNVQSRGIGSGVLTYLKKYAEEQRKSITLETFPESWVNDFYLRNGFRLIKASSNEKRYDFVPASVEAPA